MTDALGCTKVGFAYCAITRFKALCNTSLNEQKPLRLVRAFRLERRAAFVAELLSHKLLHRWRTRGWQNEWYKGDLAHISKVVRRAISATLKATAAAGGRKVRWYDAEEFL